MSITINVDVKVDDPKKVHKEINRMLSLVVRNSVDWFLVSSNINMDENEGWIGKSTFQHDGSWEQR